MQLHNNIIKKDLINDYNEIYDGVKNDDGVYFDRNVNKNNNNNIDELNKNDTEKSSLDTDLFFNSKMLFTSLKMILIMINKFEKIKDFNIHQLKLEKMFNYLIESQFQIIDFLIKNNFDLISNNEIDYLKKFKYNTFIKHLYSIVNTFLTLFKSVKK